jgi:hypothetical protein
MLFTNSPSSMRSGRVSDGTSGWRASSEKSGPKFEEPFPAFGGPSILSGGAGVGARLMSVSKLFSAYRLFRVACQDQRLSLGFGRAHGSILAVVERSFALWSRLDGMTSSVGLVRCVCWISKV